MDWNQLYPKEIQPEMESIDNFIKSPLWWELCNYVESTFGVKPKIEHSCCSAAPGWNVKYKKSSRSLCTLYPKEGFFTALVCIGKRESDRAELILADCCSYLQKLYQDTASFNGSRWLMIDVTDQTVVEGVKLLIAAKAGK